MVDPYLNNYTVSTVLFHKYGGENVGVTNCMSHFSMFIPTKANVKLYNGNTLHAQVIGMISCNFPNCLIIYPVVTVYYLPGHPSNTIPLGLVPAQDGPFSTRALI